MNIRTIAVTAGVSAPLVLAGSISGEFTGISTTAKPNAFGISVVNVYAEFDRPGEDLMVAVVGTAADPLLIEVVDGTFYQHQFGGDYAPLGLIVNAFPSLAFDTFVTIGVKLLDPDGVAGGQPEDQLVIGVAWPGFGTSTLEIDRSGFWALVPDAPQADPFNADFVAGDGRVLIGQFSTEDGVAIRGTMLLQVTSNGDTLTEVVSFEHLFCPWDCANGDGVVGINDLLAVLAQWGQIGSSCDFDGDGVGISDFLDLLAHKGPCPP
jgi:hypothetical protein